MIYELEGKRSNVRMDQFSRVLCIRSTVHDTEHCETIINLALRVQYKYC